MAFHRYTCPCCGYQTFDELPGSYAICHVCFWEDDLVQLLDPWFAGGANRPNLAEAQASYAKSGAKEERALEHVDGVLPIDDRDPTWRPVAECHRPFVRMPRDLPVNQLRDLSALYYWRRSIE